MGIKSCRDKKYVNPKILYVVYKEGQISTMCKVSSLNGIEKIYIKIGTTFILMILLNRLGLNSIFTYGHVYIQNSFKTHCKSL